MRIAFVATMGDAPWGGSEVLWSKTAACALAAGHEVFFSAYQWPNTPAHLQELIQQGARFYQRPRYTPTLSARIKMRLKQMLQTPSPEVAAIRKFDPDLIVVNQGGSHDVLYRDDLREFLFSGLYPYCVVCHLYQDPIKLDEATRKLLVRLFVNAERVFTISNRQVAVLQRQLAMDLPNNVVVQNPLNTPTDWPLAFPSVQAQMIQLAVVASLDVDRKGQDILFEALSSEKWKARSWKVNLFGTGPDNDYLRRLAEYYQIQDRVVFHGHVSDSAHIWANSHILIICSRIESGPMVLAEAMLSGRPVVTTPVGMVDEWVEEGVNGFVAKAALPEALNTALEACWSRQDEWVTMGQAATVAARQRIIADPDKRFLELLTSLKQ